MYLQVVSGRESMALLDSGLTGKVSCGGWDFFDSKSLQNMAPMYRGEPEHSDQVYQ